VQARPRNAQRPAFQGLHRGLEGGQAPNGHKDGQDDIGHPGAKHLPSGMVGIDRTFRGLFIGEVEGAFGLPHAQQNDKADNGDHGRQNIRQVGSKMVRGPILRSGKAHASHSQRGQNLKRAFETAHGDGNPARHDDGKERQLAAHNLADVVHGFTVGVGQARGRARNDDGHADGAKGHRRGVGDQANARGIERVEAKAHKHGCGDGHGGAETGGALNERTKGEGNKDCLQAPVVGHAGQRVLDDFKFARFHRHVVDPHSGDDNPDNRENAEAGALDGGVDGQPRRHVPGDDGKNDGGKRAAKCGLVPGCALYGQHVKEDVQGDACHQGRHEIA